jgi:hypothetical protein
MFVQHIWTFSVPQPAPGERALDIFLELISLEGDADLMVTHRALAGNVMKTVDVVTNDRIRLAAAEVPPGEPVFVGVVAQSSAVYILHIQALQSRQAAAAADVKVGHPLCHSSAEY